MVRILFHPLVDLDTVCYIAFIVGLTSLDITMKSQMYLNCRSYIGMNVSCPFCVC